MKLYVIVLGTGLICSSMGNAVDNMSLIPDDNPDHIESPSNPSVTFSEDLTVSSTQALLKLLAVLIAVIALAYLILHKGLGSLIQKSQAHKMIQIKERVALDQKRCLYLVEVADRRFVLGGSDGGVSMITEITPLPSEQLPVNFSSSLHRGASHVYDKTPAQMAANLHTQS